MTVERKYDLYDAEFKADPHPTYAKMREEDPVVRQPGITGEIQINFATRYADVERILRDEAHFARDIGHYLPDLDGGGDPLSEMLFNHMLNKDGADHRRLRALVSKAFTPARVRAMRPRIQAIADELLADLAPRGEMDLMADYAFHLPTIVILEMLGIPAADRDAFKRWSELLIAPNLTPESQAEFMQEMQGFIAYLQQLFADRRAQPTDDMISALVHAEEAGDQLSEPELFSMLMLLIVAGHETTVNLIGNGMVALWRHPEQLQMLREDPGLMPTAVEELLRYDGSVERAFARYVTEDVDLQGEDVAGGELIIPILSAANRDPVKFSDPDQLDITRSPNPHLAFGKGAHYCVGAPLARLEAEIALNTLLDKLPDLRPAVPLESLTWRANPTFRALESLPVVW